MARLMDRKDERLARWHAPPRLEAVRLALKRQAAESGAFFWDWAKYMGGPCSIHAWTSVKPPLAAPDHVTLTEAGEERSARALFAELMAGFETYQRAPKERIPVASAFTAEIQPAKGAPRSAISKEASRVSPASHPDEIAAAVSRKVSALFAWMRYTHWRPMACRAMTIYRIRPRLRWAAMTIMGMSEEFATRLTDFE